jgi:MFS transporter, AAHS family, 4-hydroxybenzoate transporter
VFFLNLAMFYGLQSWLPTMLTGPQYPLGIVALATSLSTVGGIAVAVVIGPAMDRIAGHSALGGSTALGPLLFGLLFSLHLTPPEVLYASAIPMLISGCVIAYLG